MSCSLCFPFREVRCEALVSLTQNGTLSDCEAVEAIVSRLRDKSLQVRTSAMSVLCSASVGPSLSFKPQTLDSLEKLLKQNDENIQECVSTLLSKWSHACRLEPVKQLKILHHKTHPGIAEQVLSDVLEHQGIAFTEPLCDLLTEPLDVDEQCELFLYLLRNKQTTNADKNTETLKASVGSFDALTRMMLAADWWTQSQVLIGFSSFKPLNEDMQKDVRTFCIKSLAQLSCPEWDDMLAVVQSVVSRFPDIASETLSLRLSIQKLEDCLDFASAVLLCDHAKMTPEMHGLAQYAWSSSTHTTSAIRFEVLYSLSSSSCCETRHVEQLFDSLNVPSLEHREFVCKGLFDLLCCDSVEGTNKARVVQHVLRLFLEYADVDSQLSQTLCAGTMKLLWKQGVFSQKECVVAIYQLVKQLFRRNVAQEHTQFVHSFLCLFCRDNDNGTVMTVLAMVKLLRELMSRAVLADSAAKRVCEVVETTLEITACDTRQREPQLESVHWWILEHSSLTILTALLLEAAADASVVRGNLLAKCVETVLSTVNLDKCCTLQSLPVLLHLFKRCEKSLGTHSKMITETVQQLERLHTPEIDYYVVERIETSIGKVRTQLGIRVPVVRPRESPAKKQGPQQPLARPVVILIEDGFNNVQDLCRACRSLGAQVLSAQESFVPSVTHVLSPISCQQCTADCFATVIALLTGRWVVSLEWLARSASQGKFVPPEGIPGCARFDHSLPLKGLTIFAAESFASQFDQDLHVVLHLLERAGGAHLVERPSEADIVLSGETPTTHEPLLPSSQCANGIGSGGEVLSWSTFAVRLFRFASTATTMTETSISAKRRRVQIEALEP